MPSAFELARDDEPYSALARIDGRHPFRDAVPGGHVDYRARRRRDGEVAFFNYGLAREMGLIAAGHPNAMNPALRRALLDAFALVIVNEYDLAHAVRIPPRDLPHSYRRRATCSPAPRTRHDLGDAAASERTAPRHVSQTSRAAARRHVPARRPRKPSAYKTGSRTASRCRPRRSRRAWRRGDERGPQTQWHPDRARARGDLAARRLRGQRPRGTQLLPPHLFAR